MSYPHVFEECNIPYYPTEGQGTYLMSLKIQHTPQDDPILYDVWVDELSNDMRKAYRVGYHIVLISYKQNSPEYIRDIMDLEDITLRLPIIDRLLKCFYTAN